MKLKSIIKVYNEKARHKIGLYTLLSNELKEPKKIDSYSVIIFDYILTDPQENIATYFLRGRYDNISCFYLAQTYSKVPKQYIRDNFNYLIILKQDLENLKHIFENHITNMTFKKFKEMCNSCWSKKYGFLAIDKECNNKKEFLPLLGGNCSGFLLLKMHSSKLNNSLKFGILLFLFFSK